MSEGNGQLDCSEIVTRLLLKSAHIKADGEAAPEAFLLRSGEQSLSIFRNQLLTPDECQSRMSRVKGQSTLHVGHIRRIGLEQSFELDVVEDEAPPNGTGHAAILGIPNRTENPAAAERIASLLSVHSRRNRLGSD